MPPEHTVCELLFTESAFSPPSFIHYHLVARRKNHPAEREAFFTDATGKLKKPTFGDSSQTQALKDPRKFEWPPTAKIHLRHIDTFLQRDFGEAYNGWKCSSEDCDFTLPYIGKCKLVKTYCPECQDDTLEPIPTEEPDKFNRYFAVAYADCPNCNARLIATQKGGSSVYGPKTQEGIAKRRLGKQSPCECGFAFTIQPRTIRGANQIEQPKKPRKK